jgi:uncharacterized protein YoxC
MQSQIFFFISSVGFIIIWVLVACILLYFLQAMRTFANIMDTIDDNINNIGDMTKELLEDIRNNSVFNFLFGKKKTHKKN